MNRRSFLVRITQGVTVAAFMPLIAEAFDGSGEGYARILEPDKLIVGKKTRVLLEITVGKNGIPVGGGIWIGVHHAAIWNTDYGFWSDFQTDDPKGKKFIGVIGKQVGNFESKWYSWAPPPFHRKKGGPPAPDWSGSTPLIFHQCMKSKVLNTPLKAGTKILVTIGNEEFGAIPPIYTDKDHEFFVAVDSDASGIYKGIGDYPKLDLIAQEAHHITGSAQMVQVTDEKFELHVKAEDKYFNTAKDYNEKVDIKDEHNNLLASNVKLNNGMARLKIRIDKPGAHRLRFTSKQLSGRSEPIRVFDKAPEFRLYFGDMHGHTRVSDGCGTPDEYYLFGRDEANLDCCALTDHWHNDWELMKRMAKKYYAPGRFVTFLAEESGTNQDHINLYHKTCDAPPMSKNPKKIEQFYKIVENDYLSKGLDVIGGPHHFAFDRGQEIYPWQSWDDSFMRFAEIFSNHGTGEYAGNDKPLHTTNSNKTMQAGLALGKRFGVIGSSDTHISRPGRSNYLMYAGSLGAFLAKDLTRESIWDAWWNYRVYAASFDRIYVDFKINGQIMGTQVNVAESCLIEYEIIGADEDIEVILLKDNHACRTDKSANGIVKVSFEDSALNKDHFYYLRAVQRNGHKAWSTPIWVSHNKVI